METDTNEEQLRWEPIREPQDDRREASGELGDVRLVVALERRQATPPTLAEWVIAF